MNNSEHPVIVPSALSSGTALWCIVFGLYFVAALCAYNAWCRLSAADARLEAPSSITIQNDLYKCKMPKAVRRYSLVDNQLVMYFSETNTTPILVLTALRDPAFSYRAIDINPALAAFNLQMLLDELGFIKRETGIIPVVLGCDFSRIKPGVMAGRYCFDLGNKEGLAYACCQGNTLYLMVTLWEDGQRVDIEKLRVRMLSFFKGVEFLAPPDLFERPLVNSSEMTAADHERILAEVAREKMIWKMFADRVATEPESALVAAIEHFRKALELLSSVREERELVESADFKRYEGFLEQRAKIVHEWFVLMDKYLATGDNDSAKEQADFIQRHATLQEESLDRQRAADVRARLLAREKQNGGK